MSSSPRVPGLTSRGGWYYYRPPWTRKHPGQPRPKRIALHTRDLDEALEAVGRLKRDGIDRAQSGDSLALWAGEFLRDKAASRAHRRHTARAARRYLEAFAARFASTPPGRLTRGDLRAWYGEILAQNIGTEDHPRQRTQSTAHSYLRHVSSFLSWLEERGVIAKNPALRLRLPTPRQSRRDRFCSAAERDLLIATAHRDDLRYILVLGFHCGLRIQEIVESRGEWFEMGLARPILTVRNHGHDDFETKSGTERQVPLNDFVVEFLRSYGIPSGYMLHPDKDPARHSLRYDPRALFSRHVARHGLPWVTFHTLRHTFVSLALQAGINPFKVRRYAGLTEKAFETHYAGLVPDHDINLLLAPPSPPATDAPAAGSQSPPA